jgi:hypothetical protein
LSTVHCKHKVHHFVARNVLVSCSINLIVVLIHSFTEVQVGPLFIHSNLSAHSAGCAGRCCCPRSRRRSPLPLGLRHEEREYEADDIPSGNRLVCSRLSAKIPAGMVKVVELGPKLAKKVKSFMTRWSQRCTGRRPPPGDVQRMNQHTFVLSRCRPCRLANC